MNFVQTCIFSCCLIVGGAAIADEGREQAPVEIREMKPGGAPQHIRKAARQAIRGLRIERVRFHRRKDEKWFEVIGRYARVPLRIKIDRAGNVQEIVLASNATKKDGDG